MMQNAADLGLCKLSGLGLYFADKAIANIRPIRLMT
jgi:hypothetical protein